MVPSGMSQLSPGMGFICDSVGDVLFWPHSYFATCFEENNVNTSFLICLSHPDLVLLNLTLQAPVILLVLNADLSGLSPFLSKLQCRK